MRRIAMIPTSVLLLLLFAVITLAQGGGPYNVSWFTVDGGGGKSAGDGYAISGSIGQPDAGVLAGGDYALGGGFWGGGAVVDWQHNLYLPVVLRGF